MNVLQQIFKEHYEEMLYILHPRSSVIENVEKMINCGDPSFGGAMFACPSCGNFKFLPFRCHSRFCPTCGNMYSIDRTTSMSFKLIDVPHRHCVFTIPEELRHFFLEDRSLLNCLFSAVNSVISRMFHKDNKTELFTPGFLCVLHTFGRDLKWNPHIHCLVSEGGIDNSLHWAHKKHFNFSFLRYAFQTALLQELHLKLGSSFKKVKATIYSNHKDGFYVYARHRVSDKKLCLAIPKEKHHVFLSFHYWRSLIVSSFGYDPLCCPSCQTTMLFLELYHRRKRVSLSDLYKKVMRTYDSHSP